MIYKHDWHNTRNQSAVVGADDLEKFLFFFRRQLTFEIAGYMLEHVRVLLDVAISLRPYMRLYMYSE